MTNSFGRPKAVDLIKTKTRIVTAGRLDMYTTGAIILTNDGELIQELTHPKHDMEKEYYVTVRGKVSDEKLDMLKNGVTILVDDKKYDTGKSIIKILRIFFWKKWNKIQHNYKRGEKQTSKENGCSSKA